MKTILIVNYPKRRCGIWEFGHSLHVALSKYCESRILYTESSSAQYIQSLCDSDYVTHVLWNDRVIKNIPVKNATNGLILHEHYTEAPEEVRRFVHNPAIPFDSRIKVMPRFLPEHRPSEDVRFREGVLGTFGFIFNRKAIELLPHIIHDYDEFRVLCPTHYSNEKNKKRMSLIKEVATEVCTDYLTYQELVDWLAENEANALHYVGRGGGEVYNGSSALDWMMLAGRPLIINDSPFFHHVLKAVDATNVGGDKKKLWFVRPESYRHLVSEWHPLYVANAYDEW